MSADRCPTCGSHNRGIRRYRNEIESDHLKSVLCKDTWHDQEGSSEWKELDIGNLPSDIFSEERPYDVELNLYGWWVECATYRDGMYDELINLLMHDTKARYRRKKHEDKMPSHKEIMSKCWRFGAIWSYVQSYNCEKHLYKIDHGRGADWRDANYFSGLESADIPPEA